MANTLTGLVPTLYEAMDRVCRELTGFIPAVGRNSSAERAAVGEPVRVPVVPTIVAQDIAPGVTAPDNGDQNLGYLDITIDKSRYAPIRWNGEEQKGVGNAGVYNAILADQFTQAMRTLVNEVEADIAVEGKNGSSRAYGTAGTSPFASDLSDLAQMFKIMQDNGAPMSDLQAVINTTAGAKMRTLAQLNKANEAGADDMLRRGVLLDIFGFSIRESAKVALHTKGTGASYVTNNATGYAAGASSIAVDTGSGTVLAGDVVTFNGDTNKYVVNTALAGGSLSIGKPGLLAALADGVAMTVGNSYTGNLVFDRNAIQLVTRAPAMPEGGDAADDVMEITDPVSGLSFQVAVYKQYRQVRFEIGLAWGVKAVKSEFIATLLG